jgi:Fe-S oxidoreductase
VPPPARAEGGRRGPSGVGAGVHHGRHRRRRLCCGPAAPTTLQPELAADIRDRKVAAILRAAGGRADPLVVSANPGCAMHLAAAGLVVRHPADLLAEALDA